MLFEVALDVLFFNDVFCKMLLLLMWTSSFPLKFFVMIVER